jgi:ABC-type branched-subunit amino acid transport system ATPase component
VIVDLAQRRADVVRDVGVVTMERLEIADPPAVVADLMLLSDKTAGDNQRRTRRARGRPGAQPELP